MKIKERWKRTLRRMIYRENVCGYFTVEAALVMPLVFMSYMLIALLLCYIYERCIWEQNACRLSVWKEYVKGFVNRNPEYGEDVTDAEICRYILGYLNEEEESRYLLGQEISAEIVIRGEYIKIARGIQYTQFGNKLFEMQVSEVVLEPVVYLRTVKGLKDKVIDDEGENNNEE